MRYHLYTIGYERRNIAEFIAILKDSGVNVLVDVREVPWSHKVDFAKKRLEEHLNAVNIKYVHAKFAGNPKSIRKSVELVQGSNVLTSYATYLRQNEGLIHQFDALIASFHNEGEIPCIMCFESNPQHCHRKILSDNWQSRGNNREVIHLPVERHDDIQQMLGL